MSQSAKLAPDPFSPRKILVAEDNAINQKVAVRLLAQLGYQSEVAENGCKALDLLRTSDFVAILMDLDMPVMDGLSATRAIRDTSNGFCAIPIIALTANAFDGTRDQCMAAGMNDFLTKPIDRTKFQAALDRWAGNQVAGQKLTA